MNLNNKKSDLISGAGGAFSAIESNVTDFIDFIPAETSETLINSIVAIAASFVTTFLKDKLFDLLGLGKPKSDKKPKTRNGGRSNRD